MLSPPSHHDVTSARPTLTAELMATTGLDERLLSLLVHRFYAAVRADPLLAPIFLTRIDDWDAHLVRMVMFWSSVALMTGRYHGPAMAKHAHLPVRRAHFARWLELFCRTAHATCPPAGAAHLIAHAERITRALYRAHRKPGPAAPGCSFDLHSRKETSMTETGPLDDAAALTRYIEERYHERHREQLPELIAMAEKVEAVHAGMDDVPTGLGALLRRMRHAMEDHMQKEEMILFPAIRQGGMPGIEHPIRVMRADHDDHVEDMAEIRELTGGPRLPEGACGTWTALYAGLETFMTDLGEHMRLENEVLFPQFEP